jgi:hypothetical protein
MAWPVGIPSRGSMAETRRRAPPNSRCGDGYARAIAVAGYIRQQLKGTVKKKVRGEGLLRGLLVLRVAATLIVVARKMKGKLEREKR